MREFVRIGAPEHIRKFRDQWMARAESIAESIGLTCEVAPANDPFFGRAGALMATSQLQQSLKFEMLVPIYSKERPTACMSFNYHRDHFGEVWGLTDADGAAAHTGCVAFGMDRIALALFRTHGVKIKAWPRKVRQALKI
jgi:seryl-tRNA synthetase